ncbi:hypothetical protein AMTRI_Chr08g168560 [Amborella trichopoda]
MAASTKNRLSLAMERTGKWVFSQEIPTDVVVEVGEANFSLHKFMLVAKSGYIRKMIMESKEADLSRIELPDIPGGPETFEKAAKFCYGANFEITVKNVAALLCAAEYLEMSEKYCEGNLISRAEDFLVGVALTSLSGAVAVLKSCEELQPMAEELNIVTRCIDTASIKACNESNFPTRSPPDWWIEELLPLNVETFQRIVAGMKGRGARPQSFATALMAYSERSLKELIRDHTGNGTTSLTSSNIDTEKNQKKLLENIVAILSAEKVAFPVNFLCCLLRASIFLNCSMTTKNELERRISAILEHVGVDDLLVLSFTYDGERLFDLESVRRIILEFIEKEKAVGFFNGEFKVCSSAMQRVAKTIDTYLGEIATDADLSISKFTSIANLIPKAAKKFDDDLYRSVDIYLKAHPNLDEIEREKVCSVMDPLKLSYEARVHASQNKRLPVQIVLHALYYDQLKIRSGKEDAKNFDASFTRNQVQADISLIKENESLKSELAKMKSYVDGLQKGKGIATKSSKKTFFSSMSKKLGRLNPFRHGSKDTLNVEDGNAVDITKPRKRRFSIS